MRVIEAQKRVTTIITAISWQPSSLCSVSEMANTVNVKEMNGRVQCTTWIQNTQRFHQTPGVSVRETEIKMWAL